MTEQSLVKARSNTRLSEFRLVVMADKLVEYTLIMVGKKEDRNPRFPRLLYDNYVNTIVNTTTDLQKEIIFANETRDTSQRLRKQETAMQNCIYLAHLVRVAENRGYISIKQSDDWQRNIDQIHLMIRNWRQSTEKRQGNSE